MTASMLFILGCMVAAMVWPRKRSGSEPGSCASRREPRWERGSYLPESPRSRRNRPDCTDPMFWIAHGGSVQKWE